MSMPYKSHGRAGQKGRTRSALISATRALVAKGMTPSVEAAAAAALISRTTAYRYFSSQQALLVAAHPEIRDVIVSAVVTNKSGLRAIRIHSAIES